MGSPPKKSLHEDPLRTIFLLYELGHVAELERLWRAQPEEQADSVVVALRLDIEAALTKRGIAYSSGRYYRPLDTKRFTLSEEWTKSLFESSEWKWFQYRGLQLSEIFSISVQLYFVQVLYYAAIVANLLTANPRLPRLIVFPSFQQVPLKGRILERERIAAVVACARLVGEERGIEVKVPQVPVSVTRERENAFLFACKRILLEWGIRIWNAFLTLSRPRGTPRILASDYWTNIEPILSRLPRGELMLFDRSEALKAGLQNVWRYRIRLFNFDSFSVRSRKPARVAAQKVFEEQWRSLQADELPEFLFEGVSLRPLLVTVLESILLSEMSETLHHIDGAYEMLKVLTPEIVFLRASVSAQMHFCILAMAARASGVPSLELQHGLEYLGPGSISKRHSAEYVAVYGQAIQDEFAELGLPREKFPIVGSPRFDSYKDAAALAVKKPRAGGGLSVLCIGFSVGSPWFYDEYDLEGYYTAFVRALEQIPGSSVIIKMRPGSLGDGSSRAAMDALFARVQHTFAEYEPLPELFTSTDVVVSYYSTTVLEALQFSKPVIVFGAQAMENECIRVHFTRYAEVGGLLIAKTPEELAKACRSFSDDSTVLNRLSQGAGETLSRFCQFDGKASERIVELIERLMRRY